MILCTWPSRFYSPRTQLKLASYPGLFPIFNVARWKTGRPGRCGDVIGCSLGRGLESPPTRPRNETRGCISAHSPTQRNTWLHLTISCWYHWRVPASKKRQLVRALGLCVDAMTNNTVWTRKDRHSLDYWTSNTVHAVPGTVYHACRRSKRTASTLPRWSIVRSHAFNVLQCCTCTSRTGMRMGEWAEILNRVPNRIRLHHQIDQAFPFFSVQHWKNWEKPGYEASRS